MNTYMNTYTDVMTATTIRVTPELRDRVNRDAGILGLTAGGLIERLLDEHDRNQRFAALGRAFASADASYWAEFELWSATNMDGLRDD